MAQSANRVICQSSDRMPGLPEHLKKEPWIGRKVTPNLN
jgi:hypothetical protein